MNPRIRELVKQAGGHFGKDQEFAVVFGELDDFKKFSELIVRECANIACEYDAPKMSGPGMIIAARIETHFGVEE